MKSYRNLKEVKIAALQVNSVTSGSDAFMYKCFPLMVKTLLSIENELHSLRMLLEPKVEKIEGGEEVSKDEQS